MHQSPPALLESALVSDFNRDFGQAKQGTGNCYTFTFPNGRRWGFTGTHYAAAPEDSGHQYGKFKLCRDMDCSASGPINPGNGFFLRDVHGKAKSKYIQCITSLLLGGFED